MPNPKIIEETPINLANLKSIFIKLKKRDEELNYRLSKMQEFFEAVPVLKKKEADELFTKLKDLEIPRLKDNMIQKIINLQPKTLEELKIIFPSDQILKKYNEFSESILQKLIKNQKSIFLLRKIHDSLLPKLMSGDIRV